MDRSDKKDDPMRDIFPLNCLQDHSLKSWETWHKNFRDSSCSILPYLSHSYFDIVDIIEIMIFFQLLNLFLPASFPFHFSKEIGY